MTHNITINGGAAWTICVDGKMTDVGVLVTDRYRVYKRAGEAGVAVADKLGDMIGSRLFFEPKRPGQTTEFALLAAISATM